MNDFTYQQQCAKYYLACSFFFLHYINSEKKNFPGCLQYTWTLILVPIQCKKNGRSGCLRNNLLGCPQGTFFVKNKSYMRQYNSVYKSNIREQNIISMFLCSRVMILVSTIRTATKSRYGALMRFFGIEAADLLRRNRGHIKIISACLKNLIDVHQHTR